MRFEPDADAAGVAVSHGSPSGRTLGAALSGAARLVHVEELVGLWLVLALADPLLPKLHGLSFSDLLLGVAAVRLVIDRTRPRRLAHHAEVIIALAWLAELVVTLFGKHVSAANPRFLLTLAGLSFAAYIVLSSRRPRVLIVWLALAAGVGAAAAALQWSVYRLTGTVIFPTAQNLFFIHTKIANVFKASGFGIDPNFLGMWIVPGVAIALVGLLRGGRRLAFGLYGALCVFGIYATGSRGALISALAGGVIVLLVESTGPWRQQRARSRRILAAVALVLVLSPIAVIETKHALARYPLTVTTRTNQIPKVLHAAVNGNWAGRGFEAQAAEDEGIVSPYLASTNVVHNTPLEALYEVGWIGFLVPLAMMLGGLLCALRLLRGRAQWPALLGAAFIPLCVNLQALGGYAFRPLWFAWALVLAVDADAEPTPDERTAPAG